MRTSGKASFIKHISIAPIYIAVCYLQIICRRVCVCCLRVAIRGHYVPRIGRESFLRRQWLYPHAAKGHATANLGQRLECRETSPKFQQLARRLVCRLPHFRIFHFPAVRYLQAQHFHLIGPRIGRGICRRTTGICAATHRGRYVGTKRARLTQIANGYIILTAQPGTRATYAGTVGQRHGGYAFKIAHLAAVLFYGAAGHITGRILVQFQHNAAGFTVCPTKLDVRRI